MKIEARTSKALRKVSFKKSCSKNFNRVSLLDKTLSRADFLFTRPLMKPSALVFSVCDLVTRALQLMCCTLDFDRLVLIILPLMAKYESAMGYQYQSRSISNRMMIARSPLLTASAKKMLHICVRPIQSHRHLGMLM